MKPTARPPGEFEQVVLLAILQGGDAASGVSIARTLETDAGRSVSRGALYTTLDRLETKGYVRWRVAPGGAERGHLPRRTYAVTARGLEALRSAQQAFARLTRGLEGLLRGRTR